MFDGVDGRGVDEGQAPPDPHHQPGHRRVGLVAGPPADDVDQPADFRAPLVAHGPAHHAGQGHHGVPDGAVGQQSLTAVSEAGAHRVGAAHGGRRRPVGGRARSTFVGGIGSVTGGHWRPAVEESDHRTPRVSIRAAPSSPDAARVQRPEPGSGRRKGRGCGMDGRTEDNLPVDAGRTDLASRRSHIAGPAGPGSALGADQTAPRGGCGAAPGLLGGSPRFIGHTSLPGQQGARTRVVAPSPTIVTGGRMGRSRPENRVPVEAPRAVPQGETGGSLEPWTSAIPPRPSPSATRSGRGWPTTFPTAGGAPASA